MCILYAFFDFLKCALKKIVLKVFMWNTKIALSNYLIFCLIVNSLKLAFSSKLLPTYISIEIFSRFIVGISGFVLEFSKIAFRLSRISIDIPKQSAVWFYSDLSIAIHIAVLHISSTLSTPRARQPDPHPSVRGAIRNKFEAGLDIQRIIISQCTLRLRTCRRLDNQDSGAFACPCAMDVLLILPGSHAMPSPGQHPLPMDGCGHGQAAYLTQNTGCSGERKRRDLPNRNWSKKSQKWNVEIVSIQSGERKIDSQKLYTSL